ncbi:hypothetical protein F2Q69_00049327 [Brassica cretica]|uniref:Uncharacterized protein n=1 Tax=Brassica cretica TaxID=69181 RepID=A0A8S9Q1P1_BRACR|nr:hypothetical protein F2Q69_00049327 [Brassica cretica]
MQDWWSSLVIHPTLVHPSERKKRTTHFTAVIGGVDDDEDEDDPDDDEVKQHTLEVMIHVISN